MVIARNCLEWPEISFGLAKAGLIAVPVNIRLAPDEVAHVRDDSGARAVIIHADHVEKFLRRIDRAGTGIGRGRQSALGTSELVTDYETALAQAAAQRRGVATSRRTTSRSSSTPAAPPGGPRA